MSTPAPILQRDVAEEAAPRRSRGLLGALVALVVVGGLGSWLFVRVKAAQATQAAIAAERNRVAAVAAAAAKGPAGPVETVAGTPRAWAPVVALEGSLAPARQADLGFKVPGRISSINVRLGQRVSAGTTLATLDLGEAQAQGKAAEAQVRAAEAQLALASDGARRTQALVASGSAPSANAVQAGQQQALAAAQLDAARAQLALAQANLHNQVLSSPFAGIVTRIPSGTGAIVSPMVALFHVEDTSTLKLTATASESDAPLVKVGAPVTLEVEGRKAVGKVTAILPSLDAQTRRVPVEAELKNDPAAPLLGGSFVRATVAGGASRTVLQLPASALRPGAQDEVMVVVAGRLVARHVVFTRDRDGALLVRAGLEPGERVLAAPAAEAKDGDVANVGPSSTGASP